MMTAKQYFRAITPIASFTLGIIGIIQLRNQFWITGGLCLVLAIIAFVYGIRILEKEPLSPEEILTLRPVVWKAIAWAGIAILLSLSVVYVIDTVLTPATDRLAAITWLVSIASGLLVTCWGGWHEIKPREILQFMKRRYLVIILFFFIMTVAFIMRFVGLGIHPYPWSGDEMSIGIEGSRILSGEITNYFEMGWSIQSNWSFMPTAIAEFFFGQTIFAVRLVSALAGTLAVLFTFLTARELFNTSKALAAAAFLAVLPYNVHFSRIGVHNIFDSFMSALVFWLLARGIRKDDHRYYYGAGMIAGLTIYTYAGTRLVIILSAVILCFLALKQREYLRSHWQHITYFGVATIISAAPLAAYFIKNPLAFLGRMGQEGILFNGWLAEQVSRTGESAIHILFNQFSRTVLVFISSPTVGSFFNSPRPYLTLLASILFLTGMCFALAHWSKTKYFIVLIWFWAVIFFGGVMTLNPPANTRLIMTSPPVAILTALGIFLILEYLGKLSILPTRAVTPLIVVSICVIGYQDIRFYMGEYYLNSYFQDANGELAMETGLMAKELGSDYHIFMIGTPRMYADFPTIVFINPDSTRSNIVTENIEDFELPPHQKSVFFATPENLQLLASIQEKYPGGTHGFVIRKPVPEEVLFEYYILDR